VTPVFADERLDWASAIGLFIINYGVLDWHFLVFLESRIPPTDFAKLKGEQKHFQDRVARVKLLIESDQYSEEQKAAFGKFLDRVDPIRTLRNHIAHGHILMRAAVDGKSPTLTLSLPKHLDTNYAPETRHVEFQELTTALDKLTALIEEFPKLTGGWSDTKGVNP